jgi:hypothetical protein
MTMGNMLPLRRQRMSVDKDMMSAVTTVCKYKPGARCTHGTLLGYLVLPDP